MFDLVVISKNRKMFSDTVNRVRVEGEDSDFELLSFHADTAGLLRAGRIIIDNRYALVIKNGLLSFHENRCMILAEEFKNRKKPKKK